MRIKSIIVVFFLFIGWSNSFSQRINLKSFALIPDNNKVILSWIIDSGTVCTGVSIYRSTDSLNFTPIGKISGVCGNFSYPTSYKFTDTLPVLNNKNYYKLELGYYGFSQVKSIFLKYIKKGQITIKPNPIVDISNIEFDNKKASRFNFTIYDLNGKIIFTLKDITSEYFSFSRSGISSGTYVYILKDEFHVYKGKIIFE